MLGVSPVEHLLVSVLPACPMRFHQHLQPVLPFFSFGVDSWNIHVLQCSLVGVAWAKSSCGWGFLQAAQLRVEKTDGRRPGERQFTSLVDTAVYTKCAPSPLSKVIQCTCSAPPCHSLEIV